MKRINIIFVLLLFLIFNTKVYAFSYDFEAKVDSTEVVQGETKEIVVNLISVTGFDGTLGACLVNIKLDSAIVMNGDIKAYDGWIMTPGNGLYTFETTDNFKNNSGIFKIPVKVNGAGTVNITNIECSDGETKVSVADKKVTFNIKNNNPSSNNDNNSSSNNMPLPEDDGGDILINVSPNLKNIILSEGSIDFDPYITEYKVLIKDFDKLDVSIELESSSSSYNKFWSEASPLIIRVSGNFSLNSSQRSSFISIILVSMSISANDLAK